MRASPALLRFSRYGWFVIVAAAFGSKDACFGGSHPPEPQPPAAAQPSATTSAGTTSSSTGSK